MNIWETKIDNGKFYAIVRREKDGNGYLIVTDMSTGNQILKEKVKISYGAIFGPDCNDVEKWADLACKAIDNFTGGN